MSDYMESVYLGIVLAPLAGAIIAGLFGRQIGCTGAHRVTVLSVGISFFLSLIAFYHIEVAGGEIFNGSLYTWLVIGSLRFEIGFLIDQLTVTTPALVLEMRHQAPPSATSA